LLFSKGHFFYKIDYYKFCIVIFNKSFKSKLICNTHCSLTKLLSHKFVHHEMCHIKPRYIKIAENYCRNKCQMPIFTLFAIILFNVLSILKTSCQEYVIILIISVLLQCTIMIINYIYKKIT
jgi:hypothetical protein